MRSRLRQWASPGYLGFARRGLCPIREKLIENPPIICRRVSLKLSYRYHIYSGGLISLLVGYYLDVIGGRGISECHGSSIANADLVYVYLDAAVLANGSGITAVAISSILVFLYLQVIGGKGHWRLLPGDSKSQSSIIANGHCVYICVLKFWEHER